MRDSLLHDSGLGAAGTSSAGVAGRAAPGAPRARRACTGICLHACLLRAAARGGLPGMHWDFSYPAGWLAEVLPDIVCLWPRRPPPLAPIYIYCTLYCSARCTLMIARQG